MTTAILLPAGLLAANSARREFGESGPRGTRCIADVQRRLQKCRLICRCMRRRGADGAAAGAVPFLPSKIEDNFDNRPRLMRVSDLSSDRFKSDASDRAAHLNLPMNIEPKIKLEVLTPRQLTSVLVVINLAVIIGLSPLVALRHPVTLCRYLTFRFLFFAFHPTCCTAAVILSLGLYSGATTYTRVYSPLFTLDAQNQRQLDCRNDSSVTGVPDSSAYTGAFDSIYGSMEFYSMTSCMRNHSLSVPYQLNSSLQLYFSIHATFHRNASVDLPATSAVVPVRVCRMQV
jgi:hypothetical protein